MKVEIVEVCESGWKPHKTEDKEYTVFLFESDLKTLAL